MKYNKVAIEYDHLNSVCFKRRILPLEHESHKLSLNTFRYDSNNNIYDFEILITQKAPKSLKELRQKLSSNYFLVYDNPNYIGLFMKPQLLKRIFNLLKRIIKSIITLKVHPFILLEFLIKRADLVITGSELQAEFYSKAYNKTTFNIVDPVNEIEFSGKKKEHFDTKVIRILWEGTEESFHQLKDLITPLNDLSKKYNFELILFTDISKNSKAEKVFNLLKSKFTVIHVPWAIKKIDEVLLSSDIAIAPIASSNYVNYAKPFNKLLVYWSYGLPTVFSDIPSYRGIHEKTKIGFCCKNSEEWFKSIEKLIQSTELRSFIGNLGYKYAWREHSQEKYANKYFKKINEVYKTK